MSNQYHYLKAIFNVGCVCVCVFFFFFCPGTPSTGTRTWSASSTWTLWVGSSARPSLWTERPTRSTTSPSSPWRAVSSLPVNLKISVRVQICWAPSPSSSCPFTAKKTWQGSAHLSSFGFLYRWYSFWHSTSVLRVWSNKSKKSKEWIKLPVLTSSFAAVMITPATRGRCPKRNI